MKTFSSKVLLLILLTAVGFGFSSCSDDEPGHSKSNPIVGTWRVYHSDANGKTAGEWWHRFSKDGEAESWGYNQKENKYLYVSGSYELSDDRITIDYTKERVFMIYGQLMRCLAEFMIAQPDRESSMIQILTTEADELKVSGDGDIFWLVREEPSSNLVYAECSDHPITATEQSLAGQWDLRSYYALNGKEYSGWTLDAPEKEGLTLLEDGTFANNQFWVNDLYGIEKKAGRIAQNDGIYVYNRDCAWSTTAEAVTFVCTLYERVQYDESGNEIARDTIKPLVPIMVTYPIQFLSENWLTLYAPHINCYFSFHRNRTAAAAPTLAPACSSMPVRRAKIMH